MKELELKLIVPPARQAALLRSLEMAKAPKVELEAHYFDTADRLLDNSGMSLRVRKEGKAWVQTLKASTEHPANRFEHNVVVAATDDTPRPDLVKHAGSKAGRALQKLLGDVSRIELHEVFRTTVTRRHLTRQLKADAVELAFDKGLIRAHGRELAVSELKLALKSRSNARQLFALARSLVKDHGLWLSTVSEGARGTLLSSEPGADPPVAKAKPIHFNPGSPARRQFRAMVDNCLAQITPNASYIAAGSTDADQVHQLRVGIRRLRTVLRDASPLVKAVPAHWEPSLRTTFQALGAHRDRVDVGETIKPQLEAAGAPLALPPSDDVGTPSLQDAVRATSFQLVLLECLAFTLTGGHGTGISARKVLTQRMDSLHKRVLKEGQRFTKLDTDRQHRVRKRMKRLRYVSELSAPLFGHQRVAHFLKTLTPAQDALGKHNDGLVALEAFKGSTQRDARAWFSVGWLTAHQAQTASHCKQRLQQLGKAKPFW